MHSLCRAMHRLCHAALTVPCHIGHAICHIACMAKPVSYDLWINVSMSTITQLSVGCQCVQVPYVHIQNIYTHLYMHVCMSVSKQRCFHSCAEPVPIRRPIEASNPMASVDWQVAAIPYFFLLINPRIAWLARVARKRINFCLDNMYGDHAVADMLITTVVLHIRAVWVPTFFR